MRRPCPPGRDGPADGIPSGREAEATEDAPGGQIRRPEPRPIGLSGLPVLDGVIARTVRAGAYGTIGILLPLLLAPAPTIPEAPYGGYQKGQPTPSRVAAPKIRAIDPARLTGEAGSSRRQEPRYGRRRGKTASDDADTIVIAKLLPHPKPSRMAAK